MLPHPGRMHGAGPCTEKGHLQRGEHAMMDMPQWSHFPQWSCSTSCQRSFYVCWPGVMPTRGDRTVHDALMLDACPDAPEPALGVDPATMTPSCRRSPCGMFQLSLALLFERNFMRTMDLLLERGADLYVYGFVVPMLVWLGRHALWLGVSSSRRVCPCTRSQVAHILSKFAQGTVPPSESR